MTVSNYSTTSANNTTINNISIAEGMPPSNVNNAIRNELKDVREVWNDKEWFILGDGDGATVFTRTGNTTVTVPTDITASHHVGRRVKIIGTQTGTVFSHISASAYSSPNTTLTFASGTINANDSTVDVYVGSTYVNPSIPVIDNNSLGSSTVLPASQNSVKTYVESGTHTITNKTINLANNTLTGTTAQFNTALSNNDFTTLAGAETLTNKTLTSPVLNTGLSGTAFLDEDNMASNSATKAASQQSIKAYVDSTITNQDLEILVIEIVLDKTITTILIK